jgi:hypothetical protein
LEYHFSELVHFDHDVLLHEEEHLLAHHVGCKEGYFLEQVRDTVQVTAEVDLREDDMIIAFDLLGCDVPVLGLCIGVTLLSNSVATR